MLVDAGHFSLEGREVGGDAIDMEVNEGLLAFGTEEEVAVVVIVHEEVFGKDGGAAGDADTVFVDEAFQDDGVKEGGQELGEVRRAVGSKGFFHDVLGECVYFSK